MTCIVGLVDDNGDIYIGGDSAVVYEDSVWSLELDVSDKVFIKDNMIVGICGISARAEQLFRFSFIPPLYEEDEDLYTYMCGVFIDEFRICLRKGGYLRREDGVEKWGDIGMFLIGFKGTLFVLDDTFSIWQSKNRWASIGCAHSIALGSMYSTLGSTPRARIKTALEAAERHSAAVRSPFVIKVLKSTKG